MWEYLIIDKPASPNNIFRIKIGAILKTADQEQEYILPNRFHFNLINITSLTNKETSHILKNINKNKSKNFDKYTNTIFKIR